MDPFGKINPKARKVIENVERQRQTPADSRTGSTGGSFDEELELINRLPQKANAMININKIHLFNQTAQNFYNPNERPD